MAKQSVFLLFRNCHQAWYSLRSLVYKSMQCGLTSSSGKPHSTRKFRNKYAICIRVFTRREINILTPYRYCSMSVESSYIYCACSQMFFSSNNGNNLYQYQTCRILKWSCIHMIHGEEDLTTIAILAVVMLYVLWEPYSSVHRVLL